MDQLNHVYIIAEAGVNHNGSVDMAKELIDVAAKAGVDAVKFQCFTANNIVSKDAPKAAYQNKTTIISESQYEMLKKLELSKEEFTSLAEYCTKKAVQFLATPFDLESLDLLTLQLNVPKLKISSGEITNGPLLLKAATSGKPIIMSTGMSTLSEIETALGVLAFGYLHKTDTPSLQSFRDAYYSDEGKEKLKEKLVLLHCTTEYPAPFAEVNLRAMDTLRNTFGLPVGYSDHTEGIIASVAAVARDAVVIEKHFTLDKNLPGPDHKASIEPRELRTMVELIRQIEKAMGTSLKTPTKSEAKNINIVRKSLVVTQDVKKGELFDEESLTAKRPGTGISPLFFWDWLGKRAQRDYKKDELL